MMKALALTFDGNTIHANRDDAWINATEMGAIFGKRPIDWLRLPDTIEYLNALCRRAEVGKSHFVKTRRGGDLSTQGTWLHPKLVVAFARWLSADFAVWCDEQIHDLLSGSWQQERDDSKAYYRMMTDTLQQSRIDQGKETKAHHYINEAKLINYALTGTYSGIDRDNTDKRMLSGIKRLETLNSALIGMGKTREERKALLWEKATPYRHSNLLEVTL